MLVPFVRWEPHWLFAQWEENSSPLSQTAIKRSMWVAFDGIRIRNHHRPLSTYMRTLLDAGLLLSYFDEPLPSAEAAAETAASYRRVPWFLVMEWIKPV